MIPISLLIIAVTIVMLGSFSCLYFSVYAVSSESSIAHHKAFVKKQDSGSNSHNGGSSSKDTDNGGSDDDGTRILLA